MENEHRKEDTKAETEKLTMNGGDGTYSYTKNSSYQRWGSMAVKTIVEDEISQKLDLCKLAPTICIADLGCSVGPNTFVSAQDLIEVVKHKYLSEGLANSPKTPQFQVFFNDHATNDFNTLFTSLPPERQYFAAGVPGSFHDRLFPDSSLHLVHSSYSLHYLSKPPQQCVDKNSNAYNKGKIHYFGAPNAVVEAYASQFASDMEAFFKARANEIVIGGMMVIIMLGRPNELSDTCVTFAMMFQLLEASLLDMVKTGVISESKVDSLNIALYNTCPKEITKAIEKNGNFSIERLELCNPAPNLKRPSPTYWKAYTMHLRALFGGLFSKHFGSEIIDELFDRFYAKTIENSDKLESGHMDKTQLLVVLKRK